MMNREVVVCCPHKYYSDSFQTFIRNNCKKEDRQWIYDLINGHIDTQETVYYDQPTWMLCLDKHPGIDTRYLVVFKQLNLKTIRDLRQIDLPMLHSVRRDVKAALLRIHPTWPGIDIYFHYHPSVYQLHAHVCESRDDGSAHSKQLMDRTAFNPRCHHLRHVMRNLVTSSVWYRDALILTGKNKGMRHVMTFEDERPCTPPVNSVNWKPKTTHTI